MSAKSNKKKRELARAVSAPAPAPTKAADLAMGASSDEDLTAPPDGGSPHHQGAPASKLPRTAGTASSSAAAAPAPDVEVPATPPVMLAPPDDEQSTRDMFRSMMASMAALTADVKSSTAKSVLLEAKVESVTGKLSNLDSKIEALQQETNAKFAALSLAGPGPPAPAAAPAARVQSGSGSAWDRRTDALRQGGNSSASAAASATPAAAHASQHSAQSSSSPAGTVKNRLWIKGFISTQTSMLMAVSARAYLATLPPDLQADGRVQAAGFGVAISLIFSSKASADAAYNELREVKLPFLDPKTGISECLRVTRDLPFTARSRNRVTGALWTQVSKHLKDSKHDFNGLAQSNGCLYVIIKESPVELFKVLTVKEGETSRFDATANFANLLQFGISRELATTWSDEASGAQLG
jgi:hypothetical protein